MDGAQLITWRRARWIALLFSAAAFVLVPWIVLLATQLPSTHAAMHWDVTWVGFDSALTVLLVAVALAAWRRSPWLEGAATAAGVLMLVDAWFDITTAASRIELRVAVAEAVLVELPLAALCLWLARSTERALVRQLRP